MKLQEKIEALALIEAGIRALDQLDTEKVSVEAMEWVSDRYLRMRSEIIEEIKENIEEDISELVKMSVSGGLVS